MGKISIKNLDLYYDDFKALKDVNLEIETNKITAFIGPSGCGKSTLLKSINRMNDLVEGCCIDGDILLDGQNLAGINIRGRYEAGVSYISEDRLSDSRDHRNEHFRKPCSPGIWEASICKPFYYKQSSYS